MVFFFLSLIYWGCSDGDLQIETIDFDSTSLQYCPSTPTVNTRIYFKINEEQALILQLQNGLLKNEVSEGTLRSTVPNQSQLTYRIFDETVARNYFCASIPPSTPTVVEEIVASGGEILVTTVQKANDPTSFEHRIQLSGISLVNEAGERITDLRINEFGTVTTKIP